VIKHFAAVLAAAVLSAAAVVPRPAQALVVILGEGMARKCYEAAAAVTEGDTYLTTLVKGVTLATPVELCSMALFERLNRHDRAGTYVNRGVLHFEEAKYDAALRDFESAIAADARLGEAYSNRGAALIGMRRWEEGITAITKGIGLDAAQMEKSYYNRALAYEAVGNVTGAYYDYMKAAELKPEWDAPKMQLERFTVRRKAE